MGNGLDRYLHPERLPAKDEPPSFESHYGFQGKRKERVMIATEEEMIKAQVPMDRRDYCAHLFIDLLKCRKDVFPLLYKCHHEGHVYQQCQFDDYVLRMKEFERERRLREREIRLIGVN